VQHAWNLKGLLIGNGWIAPVEQYLAYLPYAYKAGLVERDSDVAAKIEKQQAICIQVMDQDNGKDCVDIPECEDILQKILRLTTSKGPKGEDICHNMYDVRKTDVYPSCGMNWPPDLVNVTPYLRYPEVLRALHVDEGKRTGWVECNGNVGSAFKAKNSKPSVTLLPELMEQLRVVLFSGDKDLICNHLGTENFIHQMEWNGGKGFEISPGTWAPRRDWTFEGEPAGFYQEARNLTYIVFYNSSHMVPYDYSRRTRDMLDRFLGVDIAGIGGSPADSRIDGEKGVETSVAGHPNSTIAEETEQQKLKDATRAAYYKSGEVVLVVVAIAAGLWAWFVWRDRRKTAGYTGLSNISGSPNVRSREQTRRREMGLENLRGKRHGADLEAADFDESELDELHSRTFDSGMDHDRYSLGGASSDEEGEGNLREKGKTSGKQNAKTELTR
jgi:carboxypeptidase D